ncbi:MAG: M16 family metallopeptidase [Acidimicrobiales bacterium]
MSEGSTGSPVRVSRLDGGLRVVTESLPASRSVAIGVWVGVGNRDEPVRIAGVSHFLEHLLFKGSSTVSAREIAEEVDARGGDLNAFTSKEYTAFHARLPATDLEFGLDTLLDVVSDPGFSDDDVEAERQVILEELHWSADTPDDLAHRGLSESLFPGHPLGWEVLGTPDTVHEISAADIRAFHRRWYLRANLVLAVAGPIDHDRVVDRVEGALSALAAGQRPAREAPGAGIRPLVREDRSIEQAHVAVGWRGMAIDHPDRHALAVANQVLGGGWSSRLFQEIRERRGMAYTVFSSSSAYADTGILSLYAGTSPERVSELLAVIDHELGDLADEGPSERELEVARGGFEGALLLGLEDTGSRMTRLATSLTMRDRVIDVDEYLARIRAVGIDDVRAALSVVITGGRALSIVGPSEPVVASAGG